ncbi:MAG TPA: hypothetical protein VGM11_08330 [Acidobacteriaceae bacterium]
MFALLLFGFVCTPARPQQGSPQQVIHTGALNAPSQVFTPGGQWANLVPILSTSDLDLFIEDPSSDTWLAHNAASFLDRGQYTITLVSFYKTRRPCREDQTRAGLSDAAHLNACDNYRYAIRQIAGDAPQNTVTLLFTAMVFSDGTLDTSSVRRENRTRGFSELGPDSQKALSEGTKLIARQAHIYVNH